MVARDVEVDCNLGIRLLSGASFLMFIDFDLVGRDLEPLADVSPVSF